MSEWEVIPCDCSILQTITPRLRSYIEQEDFEAAELVQWQTEAGVDQLLMAPSEACSAILLHFCTIGEGMVFEQDLTDLSRQIRRQPNGEDIADLILKLTMGTPPMEELFSWSPGLQGILMPHTVVELSECLDIFLKQDGSPHSLRGLDRITNLFYPKKSLHEQMTEFAEVVKLAVGNLNGLAAIIR